MHLIILLFIDYSVMRNLNVIAKIASPLPHFFHHVLLQDKSHTHL